MIVNRRIETAAHVEALVNEPEGETLDYKSDVDNVSPSELAKDLAAFANHLGGVLLVGAFEEKSTGLPNLRGVEPKKATAATLAYENAAKDHCRPSPVVTFEHIPWSDGRVILAVNVQASLAFVCARAQSPNSWQFTVRTGRHNPPLSPDQATMHLSTHSRRVALLLASIADPTRVQLVYRHPARPRAPWPVVLRTWSLERNVAAFTMIRESIVRGLEQTVPLDDIETAWSDDDGKWSVRLTGYFDIDDSQTIVYRSHVTGVA